MNHAADRAQGQGTERERDQETNRETEQKTDPEIGQRTEEPSSVKERLLAAATKEFLERGYEKASLRRICAEAGVTTGALYFWFENKEELLDQVVGGTLEQLGRLSAEMIDAELADASLGVESEKRLLSFFWFHRDVFLILAEKSAGTKYETFMEEAMDQLGEAFLQFFLQVRRGGGGPGSGSDFDRDESERIYADDYGRIQPGADAGAGRADRLVHGRRI